MQNDFPGFSLVTRHSINAKLLVPYNSVSSACLYQSSVSLNHDC